MVRSREKSTFVPRTIKAKQYWVDKTKKNNELLERDLKRTTSRYSKDKAIKTPRYSKSYSLNRTITNSLPQTVWSNHREFARRGVVRGEERTGSVDEAKQRRIKRSSRSLASGATRPFSRRLIFHCRTPSELLTGTFELYVTCECFGKDQRRKS